MKLKVFVCSLLLGCLFAVSLFAENIPKEKLSEIREYPESIVKQLEKHDAANLVKDDYFLRVLSKELKNKNSTAEEKVYFFYLMLQKIYWAFCGGIDVPVPNTYAYNSLFQCITIDKYRDYLSKRNIDDEQFFELVFSNIEEKPILASYSYLLGSLVTKDSEKSLKICKKALLEDNIFEKPSWFRSMFIHNMMLVSPSLMKFSFNASGFEEYGLQDYSIACLAAIDRYDLKEEEKEDLAIGLFFDDSVDNFGSCVTHCVMNEKKNDDDYFILTCCSLVQNRLDADYFKQYIDMMIDEFAKSEEDAWKKDLVERRVKNNNYNVDYYKGLDLKTGAMSKAWDDISMTTYDDGILYYDDDYAEFQPFNRK